MKSLGCIHEELSTHMLTFWQVICRLFCLWNS